MKKNGDSVITKICFLSLGVKRLLIDNHSTFLSGPDVLYGTLALGLIKRGFKVSIITYADNADPVEYINGIELIKTLPENGKKNLAIKTLRYFKLALKVWKAAHIAKADIYFQQGGILSALGFFCLLKKKPLVVNITSDAWVSSWNDWFHGAFKGFGFGIIGRLSYELDLRLAKAIVVCNETQRALLKDNFKKDCMLIPGGIPIPKSEKIEKDKSNIILWVGSMSEVKQPKLFLKLAKAIPEAKFKMIGGYHPSNKELYDKITEEAHRIPNCEFLGYVPFNEIDPYFIEAKVLVNTSRIESYPPFTFVQAWVHFTPVVTLNDNTQGIVSGGKLGFHSKTLDQMIKDVKILIDDEKLNNTFGTNGRHFVENEHDIDKIVNKYIKYFDSLSAH